jgi:two-component sensor histidine kinase
MEVAMTLQSFLRRLVWVCMAPLLGLALVFMVIHVRETRSAVDDALDDAGAQLKLALDARLELRLRTLAARAQSPLLDGPDFGPQVHAELQAFREALQTHVLLADAGGRMLLNTRVPDGQPLPRLPVSKGRSAVEEAWRTGRPAVGDALTGPVAQLRLVPLVVPVLREGQPRATLVATLETRWFQDFLDERVFPEGVGAALLDSTGEAIRSTRRIINALRPQVLDDLGLGAALEDLVARFGAETGVDARFQERKLDAADLQTATPLATSLFRVAQEALNNVAKHAQAREVIVTLAPGGEGVVELRVIDDGRGLQARAPGAPASLGLLGMRERMRGVDGDLTVRPASGRGTEVIARAPLAMPVAARPAPL